MGQEEARTDFLAGSNGALELTAEKLESLDLLYKLLMPVRNKGQTLVDYQVCFPVEMLFLMESIDELLFLGISHFLKFIIKEVPVFNLCLGQALQLSYESMV